MLNLIYPPTIDFPATGMSFDTFNMCFTSPTDTTLKKLNAAIIGPNHLLPFDFLGTQSSRASAPPSRDKITPCPMKSHLVHHPSLRAPRGLPGHFSRFFADFSHILSADTTRPCDKFFSERDSVLFSKTDNVYSRVEIQPDFRNYQLRLQLDTF